MTTTPSKTQEQRVEEMAEKLFRYGKFEHEPYSLPSLESERWKRCHNQARHIIDLLDAAHDEAVEKALKSEPESCGDYYCNACSCQDKWRESIRALLRNRKEPDLTGDRSKKAG